MSRVYFDGKDVILFIKRSGDSSFRAVACLNSNSFNHDRELKEVTNKCVGSYRDGIAGKGSWGVDASGQAISDVTTAEANFDELLEVSIAGEKINVKMANAAGTVYRAGEAYITSYKEDASSEEPLTFTATFAGLGVPVVVAPTP